VNPAYVDDPVEGEGLYNQSRLDVNDDGDSGMNTTKHAAISRTSIMKRHSKEWLNIRMAPLR
jgi:hypothetical protein